MCIFSRLFKRRKTTLVAKTAKHGLVDLFPIVRAKDFQPTWTREFPTTYEESQTCPVKSSLTNRRSTLSSCHGVRNMLDKGLLIRAWEDMSVVVYPDGGASFVGAGSSNSGAEVHDKRQMPDSFGNKVVIKLKSPWSFFCDETEFVFLPAIYHNTLRSQGVADIMGVLDFKYNSSTHVFIIAEPRAEPYEIFIKAGTPIAHLIPLSSNDVEIQNEYHPNLKTLHPPSFFLLRGYTRMVKALGKNK